MKDKMHKVLTYVIAIGLILIVLISIIEAEKTHDTFYYAKAIFFILFFDIKFIFNE